LALRPCQTTLLWATSLIGMMKRTNTEAYQMNVRFR
jgi:hypothetical protein